MIGAGGYAFELIKLIWMIPETIEIVGVSSNPNCDDAGKKSCLEKGIPVYDTVDALLENVHGKADVIYVATPIYSHYDLTKQCLESGFAVWLEKPPVATIQELDGLIALSGKHGKKISVGFQYLYTTIVQALKSRIVSGEFGKVSCVKGMAGWPRDDAYYSRSNWAGKIKIDGKWVLDGTINNPLSHMLSCQLYLASPRAGTLAELATMEAELYHGHNIESEDTSSLRIITENGVEVILLTSLCSKDEMNPAITVVCEKATIALENFNVATITWHDGQTEKIIDDSEQRIHMLKKLAEGLGNGGDYAATVETCRPFTIAVNSAFDSCGLPHKIESKFIDRFEHGNSVKTEIKGIDDVLITAYGSGKLFSELGVPWAKPSEKISVKDYNCFTGDFKSNDQLKTTIIRKQLRRDQIKDNV